MIARRQHAFGRWLKFLKERLRHLTAPQGDSNRSTQRPGVADDQKNIYPLW
jgi:hypothetical protein